METQRYAREMWEASTLPSKCLARTCENLVKPGVNLSGSGEHTRKCVIDSTCVVNSALDYATQSILERMSESQQIPPGTSVRLGDSAQLIRSKLASQFATKCGYDLQSKTKQPLNLSFTADGKLDVEASGNKPVSCLMDELSKTIASTPAEPERNWTQWILPVGLTTAAAAAYLYFSRPQVEL